MSALVYGAPCEPRRTLALIPGLGPIDTGEPQHTGCSGGHTTPGLLGGWSCPCDCHRATPVPQRPQPATNEESE